MAGSIALRAPASLYLAGDFGGWIYDDTDRSIYPSALESILLTDQPISSRVAQPALHPLNEIGQAVFSEPIVDASAMET